MRYSTVNIHISKGGGWVGRVWKELYTAKNITYILL